MNTQLLEAAAASASAAAAAVISQCCFQRGGKLEMTSKINMATPGRAGGKYTKTWPAVAAGRRANLKHEARGSRKTLLGCMCEQSGTQHKALSS